MSLRSTAVIICSVVCQILNYEGGQIMMIKLNTWTAPHVQIKWTLLLLLFSLNEK